MIKGTVGQVVEYKNRAIAGQYLLDDEYDEAPDQLTAVRIEKLLTEHKSPYQHIAIYEGSFCGKILVIDGFIQVAEADYFCYHEMLVHVPMAVLPTEPKSVLVIGGGDGAAVNELGKYQSLEKIVWIDIDADVVEICRKHFPKFHEFHDQRVEFIAMNGADIDYKHEFDLIITDGTDFVGESVGMGLASEKFYKGLAAALKPGGIVAILGWWAWPDSEYYDLTKELGQANFEYVHYYWFIDIAMKYGYTGNFLMTNSDFDPTAPKYFNRAPTHLLQYYNAAIHSAAFALPTCFTRGTDFVPGKS